MSFNPERTLEKIMFISVPELPSLEDSGSILDTTKLLPLEIPEDGSAWSLESLSWEMILSGMLKVLACKPDHEDAPYYRNFIRSMRPEIVTELTQAGISKANAQDLDIAEEIFMALAGFEPDNPRIILNLCLLLDQRAQTYENLGNTEMASVYEEKAAQWFHNALILDEVLPETFLYSGHFYLRLSDISRAISQFREFVRVSDDDELVGKVQKILEDLEVRDLSDTQFKEAFDYIRMGREAEGLEKIQCFLEKHSEVWNAHFMKGWALRRLGKWPLAIESFRKAIELGGANADTLNELSICLMESGKFKECQTALEEALAIEPENVKVMSNMGILAMKTNKIAEAIGFFKTVLEYDPHDAIAKEYLKTLENT